MKNVLTTAALLALVLSPLAHAADAASGARAASAPRATSATSAASKPASQQSRMKECNDKATGMKGDERRALMKECLSTKTGDAKAGDKAVPATAAGAKDAKETKQAQGTSPGQEPQQSRMKTCNADAKGKSGDERRAFMKECLSKKPA